MTSTTSNRSQEILDEKLRVLNDMHQRMILQFLSEHSGQTASIDDLVRYIDARKAVPATNQPTNRERIEIQLHHHHLPRLAEQGFVEYDTLSGHVQYHPDETIETLLQRLEE